MFRATVKPQGDNMKAYRQSGFTLIEMVAVIIILAIMAATALPKFVNLSQDARLASIQGLAGGLRSAAALAKSQWLVAQSAQQNYVSMNGTTVRVFYAGTPASTPEILGYPTATVADGLGIVYALDNTNGYESGVIPAGANGAGIGWRFAPLGVIASSTCYADYVSGVITVSATAVGCA
jgi:prepilin-type N-terminal cleavage/methylation domain-containing protein